MAGTLILVMLTMGMAICGGIYLTIHYANEDRVSGDIKLALKNQNILSQNLELLQQQNAAQAEQIQKLTKALRSAKAKKHVAKAKASPSFDAKKIAQEAEQKAKKKQSDTFMNDCIAAMVALGMTKKEAKTTARTTIKRANPKTVEEFIKEALISPS